MVRFIINGRGRVEILYPDKDRKEIPGPSRKTQKDLRRKIPRDEKPIMYYFLVKILKLPDNTMTKMMVARLTRAGVTPDMLCLVDLKKLSRYVPNFGPKSTEILEAAMKSRK